MTETTAYKAVLLVVVFVIAFGVVAVAAPKVAFADSGTLNYDATDVMDDLTTSTESGEGFDISDYYSAAVDIMELRTILPDKHTEGQAYRAWESVFFDFDIIQLTFNKDGVYKVIPVVSSPIDIVNAVTPPVQMPDDTPWWKVLLGILLGILLIVLLVPLLPWIARAIVWIVGLPFRLVAYCKAQRNNKRQKKKEKQKE